MRKGKHNLFLSLYNFMARLIGFFNFLTLMSTVTVWKLFLKKVSVVPEHGSCPHTKTRKQAQLTSSQPVIWSNGNREVRGYRKGERTDERQGPEWTQSALARVCGSIVVCRGDARSAWLRETLWSLTDLMWPYGHRLTRSRGAATPYASVKTSLVLFQLLLSSPLSSFTPSPTLPSFYYRCKQIRFHAAYPVTFSRWPTPWKHSDYCTKDLHLHRHMNEHTNLYSFSSLSQATTIGACQEELIAGLWEVHCIESLNDIQEFCLRHVVARK